MNNLPDNTLLHHAQLKWNNGAPVSSHFDDVYFSKEDGIAETQYVFLQQNRLVERWINDPSSTFTIAETGFGTGLNFLCTWALWNAQRAKCDMWNSTPTQRPQHLHFISTEKFPLSKIDLETALQSHPSLKALSQQLIEQYPAPIPGNHRLYFHQSNVTLTLLFGDTITRLKETNGVVDAWFLDGFAPIKNPDMWQPALFDQMARLSRTDTTFSTFTSAGIVKRGLRAAGFSVSRIPGFGQKWDMLVGKREATLANPITFPAAQKPWLQFRYQRCTPGKIAIVGAGLAGCTVARKMAERGWQVSLFESESDIATQGSGNATGITFTKLSPHNTAQNRYYQSAFLHACRYIRKLMHFHRIKEGDSWQLNGLIRLAYNEKEQKEQQVLLQHRHWPEELLEYLSPDDLLQRFDITSKHPALLLTCGGWLNPTTLCRQLIQHPNIQLHLNTPVTNLSLASSVPTHKPEWVINQQESHFDSVVLACAFASNQFGISEHLPLRSVRGQVTYVPATKNSQQLQYAINYDGYINPAYRGFHSIGATFNPKLTLREQRAEDHEWNLNQLKKSLPELAKDLPNVQAVEGRVGFRCQTPDYLPIIGPIPDAQQFNQQYADLGKGFLKRLFPTPDYAPGLYVTTGHGSRGITSTCMAADILASYITGEPQAIDQEVLAAIHPARFLARKLIRGQN